MAIFEHDETIDHPLDEVWAWHTRPGALTRLSPEWAQEVVEESWPPLSPGSRARMRTSAPGTAGSVRVPFVAEHGPGPTEHSFIDRMVKGPLQSWTHTHVFSAADSAVDDSPAGSGQARCRISDRVEYAPVPRRLPAAGLISATASGAVMEPTLAATFEARTRRLIADLDFHRDLDALSRGRRLNVLIGGASGLVGTQVAAMLSTGGHTVRRLVRRAAAREDEVSWDPARGQLEASAVAWADVVVHLGGASIARRLTAKAKQKVMDSRIDSTRLLVDTCAALPESVRPEALVCASAIGYYGGQRGSEVLDESAAPGEGFLAEVCVAWEAEAARVEQLGMRRISVRTGVVMSSLGGMLRIQVPLYLAGLGGPLGGGRNRLSWLSLDDLTRIYVRAAVDRDITGPINAVAPEPVAQREFARELGHALHRPSVVPAPALGPKLLLGRQANEEFVMADQQVAPAALESAGYAFRHPRLADALAETLPPRRG